MLSAGARRVYATARDATSVATQVWADPPVRVLPLDVTDDTSVQVAA